MTEDPAPAVAFDRVVLIFNPGKPGMGAQD